MDTLTQDQLKAIRDAIAREVEGTGIAWDDIKDRTVADMCAANEDALTDDLLADYSTDSREFKEAAAAHVVIYRQLLGMDPVTRVPLSRPAACHECGCATFKVRLESGTYYVECSACGVLVATGREA